MTNTISAYHQVFHLKAVLSVEMISDALCLFHVIWMNILNTEWKLTGTYGHKYTITYAVSMDICKPSVADNTRSINPLHLGVPLDHKMEV